MEDDANENAMKGHQAAGAKNFAKQQQAANEMMQAGTEAFSRRAATDGNILHPTECPTCHRQLEHVVGVEDAGDGKLKAGISRYVHADDKTPVCPR